MRREANEITPLLRGFFRLAYANIYAKVIDTHPVMHRMMHIGYAFTEMEMYESAQVVDAIRENDRLAERDIATDARDRAAADEEALTWSRIQRGENSSAGVSVAASFVNDVGDVLAQDDGLVERLIINAAGMRKGDALRGWYAEAIARDIEALVAKAIAGYAFAAALEQTA